MSNALLSCIDSNSGANTKWLTSWSTPSPTELSRYTQFVNSIPMLDEEKEKTLAIAFWERKDLEAAKALIMAHLRVVVKMARSYSGYGLPQEDLIQEGNIGLMKAVKGFDPYKGVRLISYAQLWIKAQIQEYVLENWRIVKIGTTKSLKKLFFNLRSLQERLLGHSTVERNAKIAELLDVDVQDVEQAQQWFNQEPLSLDATSQDGEENAYDWIEDVHAIENPEQMAYENHKFEELPMVIEHALSFLNDKERSLLRERYLSDQKKNLSHFSQLWGISIERVRQIEVQALKKMREQLGNKGRVWLLD